MKPRTPEEKALDEAAYASRPVYGRIGKPPKIVEAELRIKLAAKRKRGVMLRVSVESPYAGDVARNTLYARACMLDSLQRGEAPYVSHLLYTQVLDDTVPELREQGLKAASAYILASDLIAVYDDFGTSGGMQRAIDLACGTVLVERRQLAPEIVARIVNRDIGGEGEK